MPTTETFPAYLEQRGDQCPECGGNGVTLPWDDHTTSGNPHGGPQERPCPSCSGTGTVNPRLALILHCTWGQDFDRCKQLFHLRYGEQVEAAAARPALNYGGAVHEALRIRYEIEKGKR